MKQNLTQSESIVHKFLGTGPAEIFSLISEIGKKKKRKKKRKKKSL